MARASSTPNHAAAFGARLRTAREKRGLSQQDVATRAGLTSMSVSRYERGTVSPGLEALASLSRALGVSPSALVDGAPGASQGHRAPALTRRFDQIAAMPAQTQAAILRVLDALIANEGGAKHGPPRRR